MFTSLVVMDPEGMQYYLVQFAFLLIKSGPDLLALYLCPYLLGGWGTNFHFLFVYVLIKT